MWNSHASFYLNIIEERNVLASLHFLYSLLKIMKLFNKCAMCYFHYLKTFQTMFHSKNTSTQWFVLIYNICYHKKSLLFQLVAFKIYAIIKTIYCFNWLTWTSMGNSHWEAFLEFNLNQKILKLYTSSVHWKN